MMRAAFVIALPLAACTSEENLGNTHPTPLGTPRWTVALGGVANDGATTVAVDPSGDVFAGGYFMRTADFGDGPVTISGDNRSGGFLTRRAAADGAPVWAVTMTGGSCDVMGLAIDHAGDVVVSGYYQGTVDFGGQSLSVPPDVVDMFVAKYAGDGQLGWVRGLGAAAGAASRGVAVAADGSIYVIGEFQGVVDFGDGTIDTGTGDDRNDGFLIRYDGDGTQRWGMAFHGDGGQHADAVVTLTNGDVVVAGAFDLPVSIGGHQLSPRSRTDGFLARFGSDGALVWTRSFGGGAMTSTPSAMAVRDDGSLLVTGNEDEHATIHAIDSDGGSLWMVGSSGPTAGAQSIATTPDGDVIAGGSVSGFDAAFGGVSLAQDMYVLAIDPSGHPLEGRSYGSSQPMEDQARSLATGPRGEIAAAGVFDRTIDFGAGSVASAGERDAVIVLMDPPTEGGSQ